MKKERKNKNCTNCKHQLDESCALPVEELEVLPTEWFIKKAQLRCKYYVDVKDNSNAK